MNVDTQLEKLVEAAKSGDQKAFSTLIDQLSNVVSSIALAITKDVNHSEDVSQKVFIKVWQKLGELKNNASILPWIRQLTRYTAINHLRDLGAVEKHQVSSACAEVQLNQLFDGSMPLDSLLVQQQQNHVLYHFVDSLPDESREVVLLYYREEQSTHAVSVLLGLNEAVVRKRLERGRRQLKSQILAKYGKVILATAPVGLSSMVMSLAVTAPPAAAMTVSTMMSGYQTSWFWQFISLLGGAVTGGILALLANDLSAKRALKHFDDIAVVAQLHRARKITNLWIIASVAIMMVCYEFSSGWLLPSLSFVFLLIGVTRFTLLMAVANKRRLLQQAELDKSAYQRLEKQQKYGMLGWCLGVIGGSAGLIGGFVQTGRLAQLL
ncbi:RNA polymerase sigma factor [Pseudoalteromonas luteoviolacea]|uniref:RNA polymerase sigma factor, sigma-70 family n=1 Tax=Pseudoalteromonas luteoviolacea (strain 2ta16) TaxID=1353533 RepID=V4JCQ3_PSEL2|nr:sigma-70 family RNA polymerase sigma factor [Pseudoalteromonas luteoviolacea]ESP92842.1 RNA polymerase sigma factor, sigma-70 family [Pseudoalteromonas luteoviolacea 2ta16]KZN35654.1 hypothetical protein N483_01455 [Pseudoalteromonas luteoviolacea NCIMB 1944]